MPQDWQPIETAPKDGTEVLLSNGDYRVVGYWGPAVHWKGCRDEWVIPNSEMWRFVWHGYGFGCRPPKFWSPLPETPR